MEFTFPLLLLSILVLSAGPVAPTPIRDSHGNPVLYGARYYLTALTDGNGVGMASFNGSCPSTVFLQTFRFGPPVMLFPLDTRGERIHYAEEEESLYIMFAQPYQCDQSTQWRIRRERWLSSY
uniref:Trypsin/chymotrypsin inhibitor n=1 Tax=Anthurium amnicola TaxID=1678845 RepID=A0A1D1YRZ7_9ARAE